MLSLRKKNKQRANGQKNKMPILRKQNYIQVKKPNNKSKSKIKMDKSEQEKIGKLQLLEQQLQQFALQRQQFQTQLFEIESALTESEKTEKAYKIVGNLMVVTDKETLKKELEQKKEIVHLRIKNIEKQEKRIQEDVKKLQEDILGKMKK